MLHVRERRFVYRWASIYIPMEWLLLPFDERKCQHFGPSPHAARTGKSNRPIDSVGSEEKKVAGRLGPDKWQWAPEPSRDHVSVVLPSGTVSDVRERGLIVIASKHSMKGSLGARRSRAEVKPPPIQTLNQFADSRLRHEYRPKIEWCKCIERPIWAIYIYISSSWR